MKIIIDNNIMMDQDLDMVHEEANGEYKEKGEFSYLIYTNSEKERVILKFNADKLTVTRFSNPQSIMTFEKDHFAAAQIPSPLGLQRLVTKTTLFELKEADQELILHYQLLPHPEAEEALADYRMRLRWETK
ncbi:DUF1934 domain-containing protein [Streptococcus halotolerans]|uniref:DUF1934 domain-containing protein n=1 Tax=Streptococcus halotolerans TaxID=1814128 RepID=UPI0007880266|nr:DUF1934 domain-containing protein [Streptococcus halotolerans]